MRLLEPKHAASSDVGDLKHACSADGVEVDSNSVCIPLSSNAASKDIFSKVDTEVIHKVCAHIIAHGLISDTRITDALHQTSDGRCILESFSLFQLRNRLKYERQKVALTLKKH